MCVIPLLFLSLPRSSLFPLSLSLVFYSLYHYSLFLLVRSCFYPFLVLFTVCFILLFHNSSFRFNLLLSFCFSLVYLHFHSFIINFSFEFTSIFLFIRFVFPFSVFVALICDRSLFSFSSRSSNFNPVFLFL